MHSALDTPADAEKGGGFGYGDGAHPLASFASSRIQAARTARTNQQRAAAILAAPPSVPGDDAASAQAQIDAWIAEKGTQ